MSEQKIVSETNLPKEEIPTGNEVNNVTETEMDPVRNSSVIIDAETRKSSKDKSMENVLAKDETVAIVVRKSKTNLEASSSNLIDRPSGNVPDLEQLPEEASVEQSDSYHSAEISEMNYLYESEMEENELLTQGDFHARVTDLVDPKDPNVVRLQTDTQILQLSKLPVLPPVVPENSQERIFDAELPSSDTTQSFTYREPSVIEYDRSKFFENLGEVPDVTDISSDSEKSEKRPEIRIQKGSGHFVDPLTGSELPLEVPQQLEVEEKPETEHSEASEKFELEVGEVHEEFSFEDFDAIHLADESEMKPIQQDVEEEDMLDILIAKNLLEGKIKFITDIEEEEKSEEELNMEEILLGQVDKFLDDLIKSVVKFVAREESAVRLRQSLDKMKLFEKIASTVTELTSELSMRTFLEHKAAEYYRRRQQLSYLLSEKEPTLADYEKKKDAHERLDFLLGQETFMTKKITSKIADLKIQKDELEETEKAEVAKFEHLVRSTLKKDEMPRLADQIEYGLGELRKLSNEISEVRATVIRRQDSLGTIKAQIEELENIGHGLLVADYEEIQRQTININKKIEDRNNDLNKLHDRFHDSVHTMAHIKVRSELFARRMTLQARKLKVFETERALCRQGIYELKKQRKRIKDQISDLSLQSGLLDKPILLQDYDETVEYVEQKQTIVEELRQTQKKLENKLKQMEKVLTIK